MKYHLYETGNGWYSMGPEIDGEYASEGRWTLPIRAEEIRDRCERCGFNVEKLDIDYHGGAWRITVPDDDPTAAFAFRMFVQP